MTGAAHDSIILVGREREQTALREQYAAARAGRGGLVLIGGEAGIGKTALAESLCGEATEQGALVLTGRCYDLTETPPYGPWIELFGGYRQRDNLPLLPVAFARRDGIGDVSSQTNLFEQARDFLAALAARQPVMLLLDDLHWADVASLDLLRFLGRTLATMPLLLIATYRADELTRRHPLYQLLPVLVRESGATRIDVRPLTESDVATLVVQRYCLTEHDRRRLVTYLHMRSEGNPFFAGELLRTLEEEGELRARDGSDELGDLTRVRVPTLLRQVIDGRLTRLSEEAQRLLAVAAVIGQAVPLPLWAAVGKVDEEAVSAVVEEVARARLLDESPDGAQARFIHALIREALYEGIVPSRQRRMHRQVGEALVASPDPDPDAVAYHFRQAGDARAVEWLITAGDRARRAWAWPTASERYEAALARLEVADATMKERGWMLFRLADVSKFYNARQGITYLEEAERLAIATGDRVLAAFSLLGQGRNRYLQGEIRRGLAEIAAGAAALSDLSADDRSRMGTLDLDGALNERYAWGLLLNNLANTGRFAEAHAIEPRIFADRSDAATAERDPTVSAFAYRGLGFTHASLGRMEEARQAYDLSREAMHAEGNDLEGGLTTLDELRFVALAYRADDVSGRRHLASEAERLYVQSSSHQTHLPSRRGRLPLMIVEGDWAEAREVGLAVVAVGGQGGYLSRAQYSLGLLAYAQRDVYLAQTLVKQTLPVGDATIPGDMPWFADVIAMQRLAAMLAIDSDDLHAAWQWLDAHDRWLAWSGAVLGQSEGQALWAQYYRQAGDIAAAYESAMRAVQHATEPRQPLALLAAHRLLGALDADAGRFDGARGHLDTSLALADACAAPYERALTLLARAELDTATDNRAGAHALLDEIRAICTPLGAQPALARADAIAAHLAAVKDAPPVYPSGLSAREVEVLRLVATGRTNRDIADALFLSEHTVRSHVRSILTKTRTDNRTGAAIFAREHDLA
jgi:DNA-binding CsgD family transcriptional regulator